MMRWILPLLLLLLSSCGSPLTHFDIENTIDIERENELIVFTRDQLHVPSDFECIPIVTSDAGDTIPCQCDDMDGDGMWDEVVMAISLKPLERISLQINWVDSIDMPMFAPLTNVRYGKMTRPNHVEELKSDSHGRHGLPRGSHMYPYQMDGPAWENDKVGFRHYFDGRNCCDVFGKLTAEMVLDTVGITPEGFPHNTYQEMRRWGLDILSVANSFGLGGLALETPDSLCLLGVTAKDTVDVIDLTQYRLVAEGPVRSIFRLAYKGWRTGCGEIDVTEEITVLPSIHGYEKKVIHSPLPAHTSLVTGIVANLNTLPGIEADRNGYHAIMTHDQQTVNCETYLGLAIIVPDECYGGNFNAPDSIGDIRKTWCARLRQDSNGECKFRAYAAWELSDTIFASRQHFISYIDSEMKRISTPVKIIF